MSTVKRKTHPSIPASNIRNIVKVLGKDARISPDAVKSTQYLLEQLVTTILYAITYYSDKSPDMRPLKINELFLFMSCKNNSMGFEKVEKQIHVALSKYSLIRREKAKNPREKGGPSNEERYDVKISMGKTRALAKLHGRGHNLTPEFTVGITVVLDFYAHMLIKSAYEMAGKYKRSTITPKYIKDAIELEEGIKDVFQVDSRLLGMVVESNVRKSAAPKKAAASKSRKASSQKKAAASETSQKIWTLNSRTAFKNKRDNTE